MTINDLASKVLGPGDRLLGIEESQDGSDVIGCDCWVVAIEKADGRAVSFYVDDDGEPQWDVSGNALD